MRCHWLSFAVVALIVGMGTDLVAEDSQPTLVAIRAAIEKSIPQLEKGAAGSADQRMCFTCHNQALPVLALSEAGNRGFKIDKDNLARQLSHTADLLERGRKNYLLGKGQGGKAIMAGYALWTLEAGGRQPDETTAAVTEFLLKYQQQKNHWSHPGKRPPSSGSDFTTTYVALRGLAAFGTKEQSSKIKARMKTIRKWMLSETPKETEDRVFQLRSLSYFFEDDATIKKKVEQLLKIQQDDGGWAQNSNMECDPYATASVLVAVIRSGNLKTNHKAIQHGLQYLLDTQMEDGTWHVVTRAKPFQPYYETGFPHGKDQFISIAASSWATLALLIALPEEDAKLLKTAPAKRTE